MGPVLQLVTALGLFLGVAYVLWRPQWAVLFIIVMFPLEQLVTAYFPVLNQSSWMFNVGIGSLALVAVLSKISRGGSPALGYKNPVLILIIGLYGIAVMSLLWSPARDSALSRLVDGAPYHILYLLLLPLLITDLQDFRRVMVGVMVAGSAIALLIIANPSSAYYSGRLNLDLGMYAGEQRGNPLAIAEMGALMALVGALMINERRSTLMNIVRIAAVILGLGLAIGSGSRGQVLAAVLTGIAFFPIARRLHNPRQFLLVTASFLFMAGMFYITFKIFVGDQNANRWAVGNMFRDIGQRFDYVWQLFAVWVQTPGAWPFGLGANAFSVVREGTEGGYVHNMAAEVLCEEGIAGAAIFVTLIVLTIKNGSSLVRLYAQHPQMRSAAAVLLASCLYALLLALKQGSFLNYPGPLIWWLLLAKVVRYEMIVADEQAAYADDEAFEDAGGYESDFAGEYDGDYGDEEGLLATP
jgi:hypothetical protein